MPTTIQIMDDTREKLENLKKYPRETFDEVVNELIELSLEDEKEFNKATKEGVKRAKEDIKKGKVYSTKELIEELGI